MMVTRDTFSASGPVFGLLLFSLALWVRRTNGSAHELVVHTGTGTEFGKVSERLKLRSPETEFERGVRRFGYFLLEVTLVLVLLFDPCLECAITTI
jgi:Mg2+-importing ATPase